MISGHPEQNLSETDIPKDHSLFVCFCHDSWARNWISLKSLQSWETNSIPLSLLIFFLFHNKSKFFKKIFICFYFMRVSVLTACMYAHRMHARGGQKRALELPRLELQTHCDPSCGFWRLNPGPLKESNVLSTTEPSLQPQ